MMIFSEEFLKKIYNSRTADELSARVDEAESVIKELRRLRDAIEEKEINDITNAMKLRNTTY